MSSQDKAKRQRQGPEERYRSIEVLLDQGYRSSNIACAIEQQYGISLRQAQRDIRAVQTQRAENLLHALPQTCSAEQYYRLDYIYQESIRAGDRLTALKAIEAQKDLIQDLKNGGKPYAIPHSSRLSEGELDELETKLARQQVAE